MSRARIWVEANKGGETLLGAIRDRLRPGEVGGVPVEVIPFFTRAPIESDAPGGGHDMYAHSDGTRCIWIEGAPESAPGGSRPGYWFVPHDVGGEGVECDKEHHERPVLLDPKSYLLGFEPGELDPETLNSIHVDRYVDRIYLAPWVRTTRPVHAAWLHQPTGATSPVCRADAEGESYFDDLSRVDCVDCLKILISVERLR